jgi:dTDP-glucose 4,6-dehydratase
MAKCVAVTGACGFIGRYVVDRLLARGDWVYAVDALTYAADPSLPPRWAAQYGSQCQFVARDINGLGFWPDVEAIIHLAAETHVDNSLTASARFLHTNVLGVQHLLELNRHAPNGPPRFLHISTDEVYGDVLQGETDETAALRPSSPYAAAKAAADHLVQAWGRTYGLPYNLIRPSNCYGLGQYPEKLIPKAVRRAVLGRPFEIHGDGSAERSWLYVEDCAEAILAVLDRGAPEWVYNVPGNTSANVREVVRAVFDACGTGTAQGGASRPGLDQRYCVSGAPIRALGWSPSGDFFRDLPGIVAAERDLRRW